MKFKFCLFVLLCFLICSKESIREIEETLNQQLFGTASDLGLVEDKEQSVLFDQGFENCVFSSIGLQVSMCQ